MSTTITFVGGKGDQNLNLVVSEDIEQVQEALVAAHGLGAARRRRLGQRERVRRARLPPRTEGPSRYKTGVAVSFASATWGFNGLAAVACGSAG
jgi:hypothetical protein